MVKKMQAILFLAYPKPDQAMLINCRSKVKPALKNF